MSTRERAGAEKQRRRTQAPEIKQTTENDVERAIVTYLLVRRWKLDRNQVGVLYTADGRTVSVGRRGQCDWRAVRPLQEFPGVCEYIEVEVKRPGGRPSKVQREYMALRAHAGILCVCSDSIEHFDSWYREAFGDETPASGVRRG